MRRLALVLWVGMMSCADAAQAQKVYEGSEAAALRCSNTLALTAVALSGAELIADTEKEVMLGITIFFDPRTACQRHMGPEEGRSRGDARQAQRARHAGRLPTQRGEMPAPISDQLNGILGFVVNQTPSSTRFRPPRRFCCGSG